MLSTCAQGRFSGWWKRPVWRTRFLGGGEESRHRGPQILPVCGPAPPIGARLPDAAVPTQKKAKNPTLLGRHRAAARLGRVRRCDAAMPAWQPQREEAAVLLAALAARASSSLDSRRQTGPLCTPGCGSARMMDRAPSDVSAPGASAAAVAAASDAWSRAPPQLWQDDLLLPSSSAAAPAAPQAHGPGTEPVNRHPSPAERLAPAPPRIRHMPAASVPSFIPPTHLSPALSSSGTSEGFELDLSRVRGRARSGTLPSRWAPPPLSHGSPFEGPPGAPAASYVDLHGGSGGAFSPFHMPAPSDPSEDVSLGESRDDLLAANPDAGAGGSPLRTLDYLGLSDTLPSPPSRSAMRRTILRRDRASTDASLLAPPPAALLHLTESVSDSFHGQPIGAHRPRATSAGPTAPMPEAPIPDVSVAPADAPQAVRVSGPDSVLSSSTPPLSRAPGAGRDRAGTVAALSGPDGRLREQDLQRHAAPGTGAASLRVPGMGLGGMRLRSHSDQGGARGVSGGPAGAPAPAAPGPSPLGAAPPAAFDSEGLRALHISDLPPAVAQTALLPLLDSYGQVENVSRHGSRAVVVYTCPEEATEAAQVLNGANIFSEQTRPLGAARVHAESRGGGGRAPARVGAANVTPPRMPARHGGSSSIVPSSDRGGVPLPPELVPHVSAEQETELVRALRFRSGPDPAVDRIASPRVHSYYPSVTPVADAGRGNRRFDNAQFRELRKAAESRQLSQAQIDRSALECLEEIVELASNYVGNTLVQRFFEQCSEGVKTTLLERLAPHLATIGTHKNGTWAAQKIIECAHTPEQQTLITHHLQPYVPALLLDQFGNYVVQRVIPFGFPSADFILDAMVDQCWEIAQGRFGARSMRACLENTAVPRAHVKRVAAAIVLYCVPLATSPNGALLLTWLLDTSGIEGTPALLAPRFVPQLAQLCTHKLASNTVLRLVDQSAQREAAELLLQSLFDLPHAHVLEEVVLDPVHGSQLVARALLSPNMDADSRERNTAAVATLLRKHELVGVPAYRRLAEQVGLSPPRLPPMPAAMRPDVPYGTVPYGYDMGVLTSSLGQLDLQNEHGVPPMGNLSATAPSAAAAVAASLPGTSPGVAAYGKPNTTPSYMPAGSPDMYSYASGPKAGPV